MRGWQTTEGTTRRRWDKIYQQDRHESEQIDCLIFVKISFKGHKSIAICAEYYNEIPVWNFLGMFATQKSSFL